VEILIVPWATTWRVVLRIYRDGMRGDSYEAEITSERGQKIAISLINSLAHYVKPLFSDAFKRVVFEAEVRRGERLLKALRGLGLFHSSAQIPKDLAGSPSLERVEEFLRHAGAPEYLPPKEAAEVCKVYRQLYVKGVVRASGGYLTLLWGYKPYLVTDCGAVLKLYMPRQMYFRTALYYIYNGRLRPRVSEERRKSILMEVARTLRDAAPHIIPIILP